MLSWNNLRFRYGISLTDLIFSFSFPADFALLAIETTYLYSTVSKACISARLNSILKYKKGCISACTGQRSCYSSLVGHIAKGSSKVLHYLAMLLARWLSSLIVWTIPFPNVGGFSSKHIVFFMPRSPTLTAVSQFLLRYVRNFSHLVSKIYIALFISFVVFLICIDDGREYIKGQGHLGPLREKMNLVIWDNKILSWHRSVFTSFKLVSFGEEILLTIVACSTVL